ncbi:LacI family DNA-binding transcriptional regulator [Bacillus sp. AFS031507]|uniref:LacI family DNA-binding transcriptional regulator n=1 Tax=Bacillus sp. AFS031507 TaxID=2033496 RepID=UPI000BFC2D43|nr:substrate-binding domain-containing protein [Bacillus sp. AFS031507]PGY09636.1 LacI family transcriptional regulator [Bacillus sp. AFS031507]
MEKVTMADVAKAAGVSKSTVSQYLNKRFEYMGEKTKLKIEAAIEELGYQPNFIARSLKQKRTSMVGIIVANITHFFSTEISRAIEDFCHQHDLHAIVCNADDDPEKEKKYIEMLRAKQVDGLIIFPTGQNNDLYKTMVRQGYPVVFVDRRVENLDVFSVITDNTHSTSMAVKSFIERGHQNIAFAVQPLTVSPRIDRLEGYNRALTDAGIKVNPDFIIEASITEMKSKLEKLFSLEVKPTAIFAANDRVFLAVAEFIKEKGIKLGKELELIVFDNIPFAHLLEDPISFISQPASEMGHKAAELLFEQINKENTSPGVFVFPSKLV